MVGFTFPLLEDYASLLCIFAVPPPCPRAWRHRAPGVSE